MGMKFIERGMGKHTVWVKIFEKDGSRFFQIGHEPSYQDLTEKQMQVLAELIKDALDGTL